MQKDQKREHLRAATATLSASMRTLLRLACFVVPAVWAETTVAADTNGINPIWMAGGTGSTGESSLMGSQDGQYLARGGQIWRTSGGTLTRSFVGGRFAFSSDGSEVAAVEMANGGFASQIFVWRRSDGALLGTITGESNTIPLAVALSPDNSTLAVTSGNSVLPVGSIRLRSFSSGTLLQTLVGHSNIVNWIAFSTDGALLASGSSDKTVRLWRVSDGALLKTFTGHAGTVYTVRISPDNRYVASDSSDATLKVWSIADGVLRTNFNTDTYDIAFSSQQPLMAAGSSDHKIRIWNTTDFSLVNTLIGHTGIVQAVTFSPDGNTLYSGGPEIRVWHVADGNQTATFGEHSDGVWAVAIAPDGSVLASGCRGGGSDVDVGTTRDPVIRVWNASDGRVLHRLSGHTAGILSLDISTGGVLASGSGDSTVRLWDILRGVPLQMLSKHTTNVWAVAFSKDGSNVFSGSADHLIFAWRVSDGSYVRTLSGHTDQVRGLAVSPDGALLASVGFDQTLRFWRVSDGAIVRTITVTGDALRSVLFAPGGSVVAVSGNAQVIRFYRVSDGALVQSLSAPLHDETSIAFSPTGDVFAAGGYEAVDALVLWRMADGALLAEYQKEVTSAFGNYPLRFSPDGYAIAYGRPDGTVVLGRSPFGGLLKFGSTSSKNGSVTLNWQGGAGLYQLQTRTNLTQDLWQNLGPAPILQSNTAPADAPNQFFRVEGVSP